MPDFRFFKSLFRSRPSGARRSACEIRDLIRALRDQPAGERRGANVSLTDPGVDDAFLPALIEATRDSDDYIRASAAHALGHYSLHELPRARSAVLAALRDDASAEVRAGAAEALGRCSSQCTSALIDALRDASPEVRTSAIASLALGGTDEAIAALRQRARTDADAEVRRRAVYELGGLKDERLLDVLLQAARDADDQVRAESIHAVHETARELPEAVIPLFISAVSDPSARVREQACLALRYSTPQAIPALMQALADEAPGVRLEAVIALGSLDASEAIDPIAELMRSDPDEEVRCYAASALSDLSDPRAAERLSAPGDDATETLRARAARIWALGATHSASALPTLCEALHDAEAEIRLSAVQGMKSLLAFTREGVSSALPALCEAAADLDRDVRCQVIEALALLEDPQAVPTLLRAVADPDAEVRAQAYLALPRATSNDLEDVLIAGLGDADTGVQRAAAKGLALCGPLGRWREMLPYLKDPANDALARGSLVEAVARTRLPDAMSALAGVLNDVDCQVRAQLCRALQEDADPQFVEPLIRRLEDEDEDVRAEASLALAATADARGFEPLKRLLRQENVARVRRRVVWALSFFPPQECLPLLTQSLVDPDEHVRAQAVLALEQLCTVDELTHLLERLPRCVTDDVRGALAQAIDASEGREGIPSKSERRLRMGTVHYE